MPECLVVAQTMTQGPLESHHRSQETLVGRTSAQDLPNRSITWSWGL
jgi:hypothetical protein